MHAPIRACSFLSVSDVLSSHLTTQGEQDQFWKLYLDGLPICRYGDGFLSLIPAKKFADNCQDRLGHRGKTWTDLLQEVRAIGRLEGLYVDLES
jgi:hypothetical protein